MAMVHIPSLLRDLTGNADQVQGRNVPHPDHPYGVRGVGEVPIIPPLGALHNAIHRAIGVRMRSLPMSPPKVVQAIGESRKVAEPAAAPA